MKTKLVLIFTIIAFINQGNCQKNVKWTEVKNITVKKKKLIKNKDVKKWWNARATSTEALPENENGYTEATIYEPKRARILGLSGQNSNTKWNTIQYGFYIMQNGKIQILESGKGVFTSNEKVKYYDVIKIERNGGVISYKRNNKTVYTSKKKSKENLFVAVAIYTPGATLDKIKISDNFKEVESKATTAKTISQQFNPEKANFKVIYKTIALKRLTDNDVLGLNALKDKSEKEISLEREFSQNDFDKLCKEVSWIRKLSYNVGDPQIKDFNGLKNLKNLEGLHLNNLRFTEKKPIDAAILSDLTNLKELTANYTTFTNGKALNSLKKLKKLVLWIGGIDDLSFIKNNTDLEELELRGDKYIIKDFNELTELKKLKKLVLSGNKHTTVENVKKIQNLPSLEFIHIDFVKPPKTVINSDFLGKLIGLKTILLDTDFSSFQDAKINLKGIEKLQNLEHLYLSGVETINLESLLMCKKLQYVELNKKTTSQTQMDKLKKSNPNLEIKLR